MTKQIGGPYLSNESSPSHISYQIFVQHIFFNQTKLKNENIANLTLLFVNRCFAKFASNKEKKIFMWISIEFQ